MTHAVSSGHICFISSRNNPLAFMEKKKENVTLNLMNSLAALQNAEANVVFQRLLLSY